MALYCGITDLDKRVEEVSAALQLVRRKLKCFFCCCLFLLFNLLLLAWVLISLRHRQDIPATGTPQQGVQAAAWQA